MQNKKRDDEKGQWLAVGILFTGFLIAIDIWYSSYGQMADFARWLMYIAHAALGFTWVVAMVQFKDPGYDVIRKYIVFVSVVLSLVVGIHHAVAREDKQVIIDSKENAAKP